MPIQGLTIIGESINDSVPSTNKLFAAGDIEGLKALAQSQDEGGASYIDVNVGSRSAEFLAEMVQTVQMVTSLPLSIDTPDPALAEAALKVYDPDQAGGQAPILNSISQIRSQMFELSKIQSFRPILLTTERNDNGVDTSNHTAEEIHATTREMVEEAGRFGMAREDCIIDPGISPIGADSEGHFKRLMGALELFHADEALQGIHCSVGLSNFTVMIPPRRADGTPTKSPLESAFLTLALPLGMDHVIGSVKRKYNLLDDEHPALCCLRDCLQLDGFDVIMRIQEFYS